MIYLRKHQKDQQMFQEQQNSAKYLRDEMIAFEDFYLNFESALLNEDTESDLNWKLYQLADIYLRTMIVYKWLVIPTIESKAKYFLSFNNPEKLKEYIDYSNFFTSTQISVFSPKVVNLLQKNIAEVLNEFTKEYDDIIPQFRKHFKKKETLLNANKLISFILDCGLWGYIRVLPSNITFLGPVVYNGKKKDVMDFINEPYVTITNEQKKERNIKEKEEFLKNSAITCIENFIKLSKLYFLKIQDKNFLQKNKYIFEIKEYEQQFIKLLKNPDFIVIKNNCSVFCDYCYILLSAAILKYENSVLQTCTKTSWFSYYAGEFIHDENLELYKHISQIENSFRNLFNLTGKKDLEKKSAYGDTYLGYNNMMKNTFLPKLQELNDLRK